MCRNPCHQKLLTGMRVHSHNAGSLVKLFIRIRLKGMTPKHALTLWLLNHKAVLVEWLNTVSCGLRYAANTLCYTHVYLLGKQASCAGLFHRAHCCIVCLTWKLLKLQPQRSIFKSTLVRHNPQSPPFICLYSHMHCFELNVHCMGLSGNHECVLLHLTCINIRLGSNLTWTGAVGSLKAFWFTDMHASLTLSNCLYLELHLHFYLQSKCTCKISSYCCNLLAAYLGYICCPSL